MFVRILKTAVWAGLFCCAVSGAAVAAIYYQTLGDLPNVSKLKEVTFETPMRIYTADNKLIGEFGESKRIPVDFDQIPTKLKQAFLAIEDTRFYDHSGIDPIGILRAALVSITNAEARQGASTITQQVARNFYLTREKTLKRKIKEIFISLRIEQVLSKDEIFELYLNKIALGHRSFGVAAAAQTYYGKDLNSLSLAEMATLAGLPKAPSTYNPISNPELSKSRRHLVLQRMRTLGFISEEEFKEADNAPYKTFFHGAPLEAYAPFVAERARQIVLEQYGDDAYTDGIEVYTTVLSKDQKAAQDAVFSGITAYDRRHGYRGAALNVKDDPDFKDDPASIREYLHKKDLYHYLSPAIVTAIDDEHKSVKAVTSKGETEISWDGIKWAAKFISDRRQGPSIKKPSEALKLGDLIFVYKDKNGSVQLGQLPEVEGALVALDPATGAIDALVGGYDFAKSKFDRTSQAKRQTGSNFKPFLYSAAVAKGINVNSIFQDEPLRTWDPGSRTWWEPKNSPNRYDGSMTLREGLARSKNVVSIRLIRQIGVKNAVEHIKKFGFDIPKSQQVESMALGSVEVTPLELVTGYAAFANGGFKVEPFLIDKVLKNGEQIYEHQTVKVDPDAPDQVKNAVSLEYVDPQGDKSGQVLTHQHAFIIADLMRSVIYGGEGISGPYWGTGGRAFNITKRTDLHGKTGTTNNVHDAWFSGFNNNVVATAWMGFDTDRDLGYSRTQGAEGGAYSALPIWAEFIKISQEGLAQTPMKTPEGLSKCSNQGILDWCIAGGTSIADEVKDAQVQTEVDTSAIDSSNIF